MGRFETGSKESKMDEVVRQAIYKAVSTEPLAQKFNLKLVDLSDGYSLVEMEYRPENMDNIYGRAHGGAIFALIDEAFETAGQTAGTIAVALNVNVTYVSSPMPGAVLRAEASRQSQTKKTASYIINVSDQNGNAIAFCQALAYRTGKPIPFIWITIYTQF